MYKRVIMTVLMLTCLLFPALSVSAQTDEANPPVKKVKQMLTEEAQAQKIPPEILKAMAFTETGYKQFNADGDPIISDDGGIGIMQVTPDSIHLSHDVDKAKLKTDIAYNIKIGAEVLNNKWHKDLPEINSHKRNILENWYWPVAAYNGLSEANDPNLHPDKAYQERVFSRISSRSFLEQKVPYFLMPKFSVHYGDEGKMVFPDVKYKTYQTTPSQQMYSQGDTAYIDGRDGSVNFHQNTIDGPIKTLEHNTQLTITGKPAETDGHRNDFVFYPVRIDGEEGYIASAYLNSDKEKLADFPDVSNEWGYSQEINYLAERNIITGKKNGDFKPHNSITREQAVRMILRAMGRDFTNANPPDPNFSDIAADSRLYPTVALGTEIGFIGGKPDGTFDPNGKLKRAHLAKIMVEAYDLEGSSDKMFTDVPETMGAHDYIDTLAANDIINGYPDGTFRPWEDMTRSNFSAMLYRYLTR